MNVNVLIAKRERDLHLGACLYFLNEAAKRQDDDIVVYVVDEYLSEENISLPLSSYSHITAHKISMPSCSDELFNKSRLLNTGFTLMRQNYDWVGIVDVDMVYQSHYFAKVNKVLSNKRATCLSKGFSLDSLHSSFILNGRMVLPDPSLTLRYNGNSQIALTRYAVELIKDIYGGEIYCEDFKGWGGEDSDMSFRLKDLTAANLLTQQRVDCMWYHLWHEPRHDLDDTNKKLFDKRRVSNQQLLQRWLNENKHRNTNNKD